MNQITTRYITEGNACYEQYVISDPVAKTELVITPERGGGGHVRAAGCRIRGSRDEAERLVLEQVEKALSVNE